jgi:hypothetical protein
MDGLNPAARNSDPQTSHAAAPQTHKKKSYRELLLAVFKKGPKRGLTSEEAAIKAGLFAPGICYWKRVSELADLGEIVPVQHDDGEPVTRISSMGRPQQVYTLASA